MNKIVRVLGSILLGLVLYSIPILCVCSYTLGWDDVVKYLLTIAAFGQAALLCELIYSEAVKNNAD